MEPAAVDAAAAVEAEAIPAADTQTTDGASRTDITDAMAAMAATDSTDKVDVQQPLRAVSAETALSRAVQNELQV